MTLEELREMTEKAANRDEPLTLEEAGPYQQVILDAFAWCSSFSKVWSWETVTIPGAKERMPT